MLTINLADISDIKFSASDISVLEYVPKRKLYRHENGRELNGFIYMKCGSCRFFTDTEEFTLCEGGLAYLPKGSRHGYSVPGEGSVHVRVDFVLREHLTDEEIVFSDCPVRLFADTPKPIVEGFETLKYCAARPDDGLLSLKAMSTLCDILYEAAVGFCNLRCGGLRLRLDPAIRNIYSHCGERIATAELSALCGLSDTHFRRLFSEYTGMNPTDYITMARIELAKKMLLSREFRVCEVAEKTGFESVFYFSRVFKKLTGMSPAAYMSKSFTENA